MSAEACEVGLLERFEELRTTLAGLAGALDALADVEVLGAMALARSSRDTSPSLPGGTARLALAEATARLLSSWCFETARIAGSAPPGTPAMVDGPAMCAWLRARALTLAASDAGPDAAGELAAALARLRAHGHRGEVRRVRVGACPNPGCEGVVRAALDGVGLGGRPDLVCDVEEAHAWGPATYEQLAAALGHAYPARMERAELAAHLSARYRDEVTPAHISRWARLAPTTFAADAFERIDRVRAAAWYLGHRASKATRGA